MVDKKIDCISKKYENKVFMACKPGKNNSKKISEAQVVRSYHKYRLFSELDNALENAKTENLIADTQTIEPGKSLILAGTKQELPLSKPVNILEVTNTVISKLQSEEVIIVISEYPDANLSELLNDFIRSYDLLREEAKADLLSQEEDLDDDFYGIVSEFDTISIDSGVPLNMLPNFMYERGSTFPKLITPENLASIGIPSEIQYLDGPVQRLEITMTDESSLIVQDLDSNSEYAEVTTIPTIQTIQDLDSDSEHTAALVSDVMEYSGSSSEHVDAVEIN